MKGWTAPEELLYPQIQEALSAWTRAVCPRHAVVRVVGEQWSPRSHELRDMLGRNTIPFAFFPLDSSEGEQLLRAHEVDVECLPAAILHDGAVLHQPTPRDIADALGVHTQPSAEAYDLVILGAGPAGLAAAVYGASEGLETLVVEPRAIGGQAGTSAMIRNYLGFPRGVSGGELAFRAWEQALLFGAQFIFQRQAAGLAADDCERIVLVVVAGAVLVAGAVAKARLQAAHPPVGQLVDIGGYRLHLACEGAGSPTVILEAGAGNLGLHWALVQFTCAAIVRRDGDRVGKASKVAPPSQAAPAASVCKRLLDAATRSGHRAADIKRHHQ